MLQLINDKLMCGDCVATLRERFDHGVMECPQCGRRYPVEDALTAVRNQINVLLALKTTLEEEMHIGRS